MKRESIKVNDYYFLISFISILFYVKYNTLNWFNHHFVRGMETVPFEFAGTIF